MADYALSISKKPVLSIIIGLLSVVGFPFVSLARFKLY